MLPGKASPGVSPYEANFEMAVGSWVSGTLMADNPLKFPVKVLDGIVYVYISEPFTNLRHSIL